MQENLFGGLWQTGDFPSLCASLMLSHGTGTQAPLPSSEILAEKSQSAFFKTQLQLLFLSFPSFQRRQKHFSLSSLKPMANWTFKNSPKETPEHKTASGN